MVVTTVMGGGCVVDEVGRGRVEVMGDVGANVDDVVTVVEVGEDGEVVEARVVGEGGEEVEGTLVASVGTEEGVAVVIVVVVVV